MTLSDDERKRAVREALTLMLTALGSDHAFDEVFHDVSRSLVPQAPFDRIPPTTWDDLEARWYVRPRHTFGQQSYQLTAEGWIAALKVAKQFDTPEQRDRIVGLRRALVDLNKGRPPYGTLTDVTTLVSRSGLPRAWVESAIQSQLLTRWFPDDHVELELDRGMIRIPSRFGADELDFDPDE